MEVECRPPPLDMSSILWGVCLCVHILHSRGRIEVGKDLQYEAKFAKMGEWLYVHAQIPPPPPFLWMKSHREM